MSRCSAASEASAARDQLGDDRRVGVDRRGAPARRRHRRREPRPASGGTKSPRSTTVCSASPISGSELPQHVEEAGAARRRGQALGDVDEQPPARLGHRPRRRQLPQREPERLHRRRSSSAGGRRRRRRGSPSSPAAGTGNSVVIGRLWTIWKLVVDQAPLDVLRAAEVRFDPPAEPREPHGLRVGQRRLALVATARSTTSPSRTCRRPRSPGPTTSASPRPNAASTVGDPAVRGDGIGGEQDAGRLRDDHALHDDGHVRPSRWSKPLRRR